MKRVVLVSLLLAGCGFPPVFKTEDTASSAAPRTVFSQPSPSSGGGSVYYGGIIDQGSGGYGTGGGSGGLSFNPKDACEEAGFSCTDTQACATALGAPLCQCLPGYVGTRCEPQRSCAAQVCGQNAECFQFERGAECLCVVGYEERDGSCEDVDECEEGMDLCDVNATCLNTPGGYECSCTSGVGDGYFCHADDCSGDPCGVGTCVLTPQSYACDCPIGTGGPNCDLDCTGPLTFDPAIESSLRYALGRVSGDILAEDLAGRTYIDVWGKGVKSLAGLECWTDLEHANFGLGSIKDILPLKDLSKLKSLVLTCNPVTSIATLTHLPRLATLVLGDLPDCGADSSFDDITSLSLAQQLSVLQIERRSVHDLGFVGSLPRLSQLRVASARLTDLTGLGRIRALLSLDLHDNQVSDISELARLTHLAELDLSNNPITNATALSSSSRLLRLQLASTGISDLSSIASLGQVEAFDLSGNQIVDLTPLLRDEGFGWAGSLQLGNNPFDCSTVLPQAYGLARRGIEILGLAHCGADSEQ